MGAAILSLMLILKKKKKKKGRLACFLSKKENLWIKTAIESGEDTEAYSEPCQTYKIERFAKSVNGF